MPDTKNHALNHNMFWPKFSPAVEDQFQQHQFAEKIPRIRLLAFTAIGMMLFYSLMDGYLLEGTVIAYTIAIRLGLDVPIILFTLWFSYRCQNYVAFNRVYIGSYAITGLSILAILFICRHHNISLPYEGLFLWLIFGYFLLALPVRAAIVVNWSITLLYIFMEGYLGTAGSQALHYNGFFLVSANIVGMVGIGMLERLARLNFQYLSAAQQARESALQDVEKRTQFIAAASHDLRQPIHAMGLMIARLQDSPNDAEHISPQMQSAHEQLNELLNNLLDMSRLEIGLIKPQHKPVQLSRLSATLPKNTRVKVDLPSHLWVKSDPILLNRIVTNLVTNAIRHSRASYIEVRGSVCKDDTRETVLLSIYDNGLGISEDVRARIYTPFERGDHNQEGLGLGLAIVHEMCDLLGLNLTLTTAPGLGCRFDMRLESTVAVKTTTPTHQSMGLNILLLQKDSNMRAAFQSALIGWGYTVFDLEDLGEDLGDHCALDVVISDHDLGTPGTGLDWIYALRSHTPNLPALLIADPQDALLRRQCQQSEVEVINTPATPVAIKIWLERIPAQSVVA